MIYFIFRERCYRDGTQRCNNLKYRDDGEEALPLITSHYGFKYYVERWNIQGARRGIIDLRWRYQFLGMMYCPAHFQPTPWWQPRLSIPMKDRFRRLHLHRLNTKRNERNAKQAGRLAH